MVGSRRAGRILAFQALYSYEVYAQPLENLLGFSWLEGDEKGDAVSQPARDFARLLTAGTVERLADVDLAIRSQLEHWDFTRIARVDLAILRISVYCLLYRPDIPHSVTIDEAVDIAKEYSTDDSYRFVNGVLDGIRKRQAGQSASPTTASP
jgi:N utilization substance protein B